MPNVPDGPVEPEGLPSDIVDALFSRLTSFSNLAVAVSGGADSLCLLVLLAEWKQRAGWQGSLEILCVDHGLRPESAEEAAFVADCARAEGLRCTILRWSGEKPASNLQEEARLARYRLMAAHMRGSGSEALLLAHHQDDQAETFLDRLTRGSGVAGLGAMAVDEPNGPEGLRLLRPFLGVAKARLEASLRTRGRTWCTDPSNTNTRYKRSRLRSILALLEEEGLTAERLSATAGHMRRAGEALEACLRDLAEKHLIEHPAGPLKLDRLAYRSMTEEMRLRMLTLMIARMSGGTPRPRFRNLTGLDRMLVLERPCRLTLGGAVFDARDDIVFCWKEPGRIPPETLVNPEGSGIWDNRYRYCVSERGEAHGRLALCLGPLCNAPLRPRDVNWPRGWPKAAFHCAPVVWSGEDILFLPFLVAATNLGSSCKGDVLDLERLPIQVKLLGNYLDDGTEQGEN